MAHLSNRHFLLEAHGLSNRGRCLFQILPRHYFRINTLSWCQISGKIPLRFYSDPNSHIAFQEAYQEDFEYSDFFRDQASHRLGDVRREFICCGLDSGLEKQFKIQVSYDQYKNKNTEL